jgi:hypothetical protein
MSILLTFISTCGNTERERERERERESRCFIKAEGFLKST